LSQAGHRICSIDLGVLADVLAPVTGMQLQHCCLHINNLHIDS